MENDRKKIKPLLVAGCFAVAAVVLLLAGSRKTAQDSSVKSDIQVKQTVLTVTFAAGDDAWNRSVNMVCDAFMEKYPEIRVVMQPATRTPGGFYDDFLKKLVATGELGDVVELKNINIASKEGLFAAIPQELTDLVRDPWTAPDGNVYTLPLMNTEQGIVYNQTVFEALGLAAPDTWQEFEQLCETLRERGYTPLVVGASDSWHLMFWCRYFFDSCVTSWNPSWQRDCTLGKAAWTDAQPTEMLDRLTGLFWKGYVNSDYMVTGDADTCEYIANGKAVMCNTLCTQIAKIQALNPEIKLGWFFMPDDEGRRYSVYDNQSGWGISADCVKDGEKYDAAVKFLRFFYTDEVYGKVCGLMSNLPATWEEIQLEDELLMEIHRQAARGVLKPVGGIGNEDTPEGFSTFWCREILQAAQGEKTREQVLLECQNEWEKLSAAGQ